MSESWGTFHHVGILMAAREDAHLFVERFQLNGGVETNFFDESVVNLLWEHVEAFRCDCAFLFRHPQIEFVVPEPHSQLAKFLGGKSALHHIAFQVPDITKLPFPPMFSKPARGAQGLLVNFFEPHRGVLVEAVQESDEKEKRKHIYAQMAHSK